MRDKIDAGIGGEVGGGDRADGTGPQRGEAQHGQCLKCPDIEGVGAGFRVPWSSRHRCRGRPHRFDELDAHQAVAAGGKLRSRMRCSVAAGAELLGEVAVEVGERLEEAFGVAQAHPGEAGRVLGERADAVGQDGWRRRGPAA